MSSGTLRFILQKVTGPGTVFLELGGEIIERQLGSGESLRVDPGHLAIYEPTVDFGIELVPGIKHVLFGGEGLFFASLKGPGRVWLQSMPVSVLAGSLARYLRGRG